MNISNQQNNIIRNSMWEFIYKIIALFTPFIIRTLLIWQFGVEYLGLNNLFASVLQIINMTELGFGEAVVYNLYKPIANDDTETINAMMGFYKKVYRIIGLVVFGIGILILPFLEYIINGDTPEDINIYFLYLMSLSSTVLSYLCFAYKSVLPNAFQRKDIVSKAASLSVSFKYITQIIILVCTKNFYLYFGVDIVSTILNNVLIALFVKKNYSIYDEKGELNKEIKSEIYTKVKGLMLYKLSGKTKNAVDSIMISSFLGLVIVGQYGNYYYILNNIVVILSSIAVGAQATVGNRIITNDKSTNYRDFMNLTFIYNWLIGVCCVCLFCLYQHFMQIWVGEENMFPFYMVICFCIYFFLLSGCEVRNAYINAAGLWWENRFRAVGGAIFNLLLTFILVQILGVLGVIIATIISVLVFDVIFTSYTLFKYCFERYLLCNYFLWWIKQILIIICASIIMYRICALINVYGILGFMIKGVICIFGANFFLWLFNRGEQGYVYLVKILRKIMMKTR